MTVRNAFTGSEVFLAMTTEILLLNGNHKDLSMEIETADM